MDLLSQTQNKRLTSWITTSTLFSLSKYPCHSLPSAHCKFFTNYFPNQEIPEIQVPEKGVLKRRHALNISKAACTDGRIPRVLKELSSELALVFTLLFNNYRHSELIVKYNIGLKTLLQQGISEPIFYGDLVYKFKRIVRKPNFSDQFNKIVKRYIRVGYNLDIMRQSVCLVLNPITVYSYGFLFNCMTVGQASDSMTALT